MMRFTVKLALATCGAIGALAAAPAQAGCGDAAGFKPSAWNGNSIGMFKLAEFGREERQPIVGLWSTVFYLNNTSQVVDYGYSEWHSDGTEILNSATHAPATQNFCLGTWQQVAPNRYKLNHFALSYPYTAGQNPNAPVAPAVIVNIKEDVIVAGDNYGGSFTIDVYNAATKQPVANSHVAGRVTGKRITINSGV